MNRTIFDRVFADRLRIVCVKVVMRFTEDEEEIGMEEEGLDGCSGESIFIFFNLGMRMLFADPVRRRGGNEKKMKTRAKLLFYVWVGQLAEPRHQINDVVVINWVKGRNFK